MPAKSPAGDTAFLNSPDPWRLYQTGTPIAESAP
jgi:hypothetical protein